MDALPATLIVASTNKGKLREIKNILADTELLTLADIGFIDEIEEPFFTFAENAQVKAETIARHTGKNVLADDSGICVNALGGDPGVFSARYAGEPKSDQRNLDKLLQELGDNTDRSAYYKAVICLVLDGVTHFFEGVCTGSITRQPTGDKGFGYDPIFVPDGYDQTFAQLPDDIKNSISHRGKALEKMKAFFEGEVK